jgi:uncharacterized membrane-anchored protein
MRGTGLVGSLLVVALLAGGAWASQGKSSKPAKAEKAAEPDKAEPEAADEAEPEVPAADRPQIGPQKIELGDDLVLDLPENFGYFNREQGKKLMEKMGNPVDDSLRGLVFAKEKSWLMVLRYVGDGYVKDDDAADLKPDDILGSIKEGTEESNEFRKQKGIPAINVVGWTETPRYERAQHHLVWGIKGNEEGGGESTNFYTRVLGRRGFASLNLIDDAKTIDASKPDGLVILRATTFKAGSRYEDFDSKSDKVAEYGLAALVVGGAGVAALKLVKVGLLAKFSGKLIAGKKLVVLALVGIGAFFKKLFAGKSQTPPPAQGPPPADPPAPTT